MMGALARAIEGGDARLGAEHEAFGGPGEGGARFVLIDGSAKP